MSYRTREGDAAYFFRRVRAWQERLGATGWQVQTGTGLFEAGTQARVSYNHDNRVAHICLAAELDEKPSRALLDRFALHEVLHLVLAPLCELIGPAAAMDGIEHSVCRALENALLGTEV